MPEASMARMKKKAASLPPRVAPVAQAALTAAGTAAYMAQDKLLANRNSRKAFEAARPQLNAAQREIVMGLRTKGLAVTSFSELVGEEELWEELASQANALRERSQAKLGGADKKRKQKKDWRKKDYLLRAHGSKGVLSPSDPWVQFGTSDLILNIINSAMGLWSKLIYTDQWYTVPSPEDADPIGSQRWHRDYDDQYLVKIFMYFSDVDEGAGPFEYIPGSAHGGPYAKVYPWRPMGTMYPPQEEFSARVDESRAVKLTGPPGTMIFCNSSGFHRGGFATTNPRLSAIYNYVSPAALATVAERQFTLETPNGEVGASEAARYALT